MRRRTWSVVVGQFHQVEVVDHQGGVGQQPRRADRGGVGGGGSIATYSMPSRKGALRSDSHAITVAPVRPSRCPSRPWEPARSTKPVSQRSTRTQRPVSVQCSSGAYRGGSRRCPAPGWVPARPAAPRRGRRRRGARSATTRRARSRPRSPSGPPPRSPRRSGCATAGWSAPRRDLRDRLGERAALAVVLPASPAGLVPPHHDSIFAVRDVARRRRHPALARGGEHPHDGHATASSSAVATCTTRIVSERSTRSTAHEVKITGRVFVGPDLLACAPSVFGEEPGDLLREQGKTARACVSPRSPGRRTARRTWPARPENPCERT